ncbi:hypothetical protein B6U99_04125 [Candidatus Geothermarchaeota archaeon ex4572_27]|nr:MAG: hypothetical protein B6U99_04125 [Candidatus Geothermarchaeota archaeon ex4572_27]
MLKADVLKKGVRHQAGGEVVRGSAMAIKVLGHALRKSLGPRGTWKMLVGEGEVLVTSSGSTMLRNMALEHPAAKLLAEAAIRQEAEVGDGTKTTVILAERLVEEGVKLIEMGLHPSQVVEGYVAAALRSFQEIDGVAKPLAVDEGSLASLLTDTLMTRVTNASIAACLAKLAVAATLRLREWAAGPRAFDAEWDLEVVAIRGGAVDEAQLIDGVVFKEYDMPLNSPKLMRGVKVALFNCELDLSKLMERSTKVVIDSPRSYIKFTNYLRGLRNEIADLIASTGARLVVFERYVDPVVKHLLLRRGVITVEKVGWPKLYRLAKATGAHAVPHVYELREEDLGVASVVEEVKVGDERLLVVRGAGPVGPSTIVVRGAGDGACEEYKRLMSSAIRVASKAIEAPALVPGGGALEVEVAMRVRRWAKGVGGKKQLAIERFTYALESIPEALADTLGLDPVKALSDLRAEHHKGLADVGVNAEDGSIGPCRVWELACVKKAAIKHAVEAARIVLKCDAILHYEREEGEDGARRGEREG